MYTPTRHILGRAIVYKYRCQVTSVSIRTAQQTTLFQLALAYVVESILRGVVSLDRLCIIGSSGRVYRHEFDLHNEWFCLTAGRCDGADVRKRMGARNGRLACTPLTYNKCLLWCLCVVNVHVPLASRLRCRSAALLFRLRAHVQQQNNFRHAGLWSTRWSGRREKATSETSKDSRIHTYELNFHLMYL